jgi:hypothetical protein
MLDKVTWKSRVALSQMEVARIPGPDRDAVVRRRLLDQMRSDVLKLLPVRVTDTTYFEDMGAAYETRLVIATPEEIMDLMLEVAVEALRNDQMANNIYAATEQMREKS